MVLQPSNPSNAKHGNSSGRTPNCQYVLVSLCVGVLQTNRQQRAKQQQLPPTAQMRHAPQGSPARLSSSSQHTRNVDTASNATTGSAQLLGEISPGKPQVAELVSPSGGAPAHNYSTDIPAASKQPTSSSTSTTTSSSKGHIKTGGGSGNNSTQRTGGLSSGSGGNSAGMHRASAAVSSTA